MPSTTTFAAVLTSCGVKNAPYFIGQVRIAGRSTLVPWTCVDQFWLPEMSWPRELTPAATYWTPGTWRSDVASSARQRRGHARALAHAALLEVAGVDGDQVGAGRLDLLLDRRLRAAAERHHRDDRADADDHAEHRQDGPHLVAVQRLERDAQRHEYRHGVLLRHAAEVVRGHGIADHVLQVGLGRRQRRQFVGRVAAVAIF